MLGHVAADRRAGDLQLPPAAEVRLHQHADGVAARAARERRDDVPVPPLNSKQCMPVPPPTLPSATAPPRAASSAAQRMFGLTWKPLMSLSQPSQVSATTGSDQLSSAWLCSTCQAMMASRTTPTLCVLVIIIGPSTCRSSSSQVVPVISPLPLSVNQPP